jgi:hypothetical protein
MMKSSKKICMGFLASLSLLVFSTAGLAQDTPDYNNKTPDTILAPYTLETRIGTPQIFDGNPTRDTVKLVYDSLDFMRGRDSSTAYRQRRSKACGVVRPSMA